MPDQPSNIDVLHDAQVVDKTQLPDDLVERINGLSNHEVQTLLNVHAKVGAIEPSAAGGTKTFL